MKHRKKAFNVFIVMLISSGLIALSSCAFAQGSITSEVIITAKDVNTGVLTGTDTTDTLGNYSYDNIPELDVIEISEWNPNRTVMMAVVEKGWLHNKSGVLTPLGDTRFGATGGTK
ncbi:MAG: hypothetical protein IT392_05060 [Nitrospirae bacterium]|nr:hypothetical protein [Nitrospirota bacterium]